MMRLGEGFVEDLKLEGTMIHKAWITGEVLGHALTPPPPPPPPGNFFFFGGGGGGGGVTLSLKSF